MQKQIDMAELARDILQMQETLLRVVRQVQDAGANRVRKPMRRQVAPLERGAPESIEPYGVTAGEVVSDADTWCEKAQIAHPADPFLQSMTCVGTPESAPDDLANTSTFSRVLSAMQLGRTYTSAEISTESGLSINQVRSALRELCADGAVRKYGDKRGARYQATGA